MRIENVGRNRKRAIVSFLRYLFFGKEKNMRFRKEKIVFYRMKTKSETANVAEVNVEKMRGFKIFLVDITRSVQPWDIYGNLPRRGLRC